MNSKVSLNVLESLRIGNNTMFGENVKVYDHDHVFQDVNKPFSKQKPSKYPSDTSRLYYYSFLEDKVIDLKNKNQEDSIKRMCTFSEY